MLNGKVLRVCTFSIVLVSLLLSLPPNLGSVVTTTTNGDPQVNLVFTQPSWDKTTSFSIEEGAPVSEAHFDVSCLPQAGTYPDTVRIDIGDDGDDEYMWGGTGYGEWGHQTVFDDDMEFGDYLFSGAGSLSDVKVRLPKSATITSSAMKVEGGGMGKVLLADDFSTDKGWTGYSTQGANWQRGACMSGGGDPVTDNSPSSDNNVAGTNIGGNYVNSISMTDWLTSPTIDASGYSNVRFSFFRWLRIESAFYDHAYVEVYDGSSWQNLWTHSGGAVMESSWSFHEYDISTYALNNNNLKVRFGLGSTDTSVVYGGWSIDDISITGDAPVAQSPSLDIGDDSIVDWSYPGPFDFEADVPAFTNVLTTLLANTAPTYTDDYGNDFVDVVMKGTSNSNGLLKMKNLLIQYSYTAQVLNKPAGENLTVELNSHNPTLGPGLKQIDIAVRCEQAGQVTLSSFFINYDGKAEFATIPDVNAYEDTPNDQLLNLADYVIDDDATLEGMTFVIVTNSQEGVIPVGISGTFLTIDPSFTPNWNTFENDLVYVTVKLSDKFERESEAEPFTINILPVNDEPTVNEEYLDISVVEGGDTQFSLDPNDGDDKFFDIERDLLFYQVLVDPLGTYDNEELKVDVNPSTQMVTVEALGDFNTGDTDGVPLWIYCDDDVDVDNHTAGDNDGFTGQEILLAVEPVNDIPVWLPIEAINILEDTPEVDILDLRTKVTDVESSPEELEFTIIENKQHAYIGVTIDENDMIDVTSLKENWNGVAEIEIEVRDDEDDVRTKFSINVEAVNDAPSIQLTSPLSTTKLSGMVSIKGQSSDPEKDTVSTEFQLDGGQWTPVHEDGPIWTYNWDTLTAVNGEHTFVFRGFDGVLYSEEIEVKYQVENIINEPPTVTINEPVGDSNISGVITISGIAFDTDAVTNVTIQIDGGPWMDAVGTLIWSYQWNTTMVSNGPHTIVARAFDGELYSQLHVQEVNVDNTDDPGGPTPINGGGDDGKESGGGLGTWLWIIIIVIIVVVVITLVFALTRKKEEEPEEIVEAVPETGATSSGEPAELKIAQPATPVQSVTTAPQYGTQYPAQAPSQPASTGYAGYSQYGATAQTPATQYPSGVYGQPTTYQAGQYQMAASPYAAAAQQAQTQQTQSYQMTQGQPVAGYLPSGQTAPQQAGYAPQQTGQQTYATAQNANQGQQSAYQYQYQQ